MAGMESQAINWCEHFKKYSTESLIHLLAQYQILEREDGLTRNQRDHAPLVMDVLLDRGLSVEDLHDEIDKEQKNIIEQQEREKKLGEKIRSEDLARHIAEARPRATKANYIMLLIFILIASILWWVISIIWGNSDYYIVILLVSYAAFYVFYSAGAFVIFAAPQDGFRDDEWPSNFSDKMILVFMPGFFIYTTMAAIYSKISHGLHR